MSYTGLDTLSSRTPLDKCTMLIFIEEIWTADIPFMLMPGRSFGNPYHMYVYVLVHAVISETCECEPNNRHSLH